MPTLSDLYGLSDPAPDQPARPAGSELSKGFKRSFAELPGLAAGVGAFAADVVGANDTRDSLLGYAQRRQQEVEQNYGSDAASFSNVMEGKASPTDFLANAAGYVLGQAGQAIASGGLTALGFKMLAKKAALEAAKAATEKAVAQGITREAAQQVGMDAAKEVLTRATIQGGTAGAGAHNLGMELGSIYPDAVEEAQKQGRELDGGDKLRVGLSALAAAAVDTAMERVTAGKMLQGTPGESIMARARREVPLGMAREGSTEAIQTGIEHYGAGQPIADEKGLRDIIDSAAVGMVGGGLAGGGASLHRQAPVATQETSNQGMAELATATNLDEAINAAHKAADVPLTGGLTAEQEARGLNALDSQAQDDLDAIKQAGRAMSLDEQRRGPAAPPAAPMPEPTVTDSPYLDRLLTLREQVADPGVRDQVRAAFGGDALREVLRAASIADRPDINLPEKTRERVLQLAEMIVSRAVAQPLETAQPGPSATRVAAGPALTQPASVPRLELDTAPTGAIRVDSSGSAAPETRADAISTKQRVDEMRRRPDGMTQQVDRRPLPRDFTLVGDGTLTPGTMPIREPAQLPAPPNMPGKRGAFEAAERDQAAAAARKPDELDAIAAVKRAGEAPAPTALAEAMRTALDKRAHEAATSPSNSKPEPTDAQREAGNYAKGHIKVAGLDISVENPAGSTRSGVAEDGRPWENQLQHHYGYIRRTTGADGEHVDVFVKPGTPEDYSGPVFVVDQVNPSTGKFDEHKVILGAKDREDAEATYRANYAPDWQGLKAIKGMTMPAFKKWLQGDTTKPAAGLKDRVDAMRKQPAPASSALPTDKLAELVDLTGRPREKVAEQYAGFVAQHGREKADELLDRALQVAREKPTATKNAAAPAPAAGMSESQGDTKPPVAAAPVDAAEPAPQPQPAPDGETAGATGEAAPTKSEAEPSPPAEAKTKEPQHGQVQGQGRRQEALTEGKDEPAAAPAAESTTTKEPADAVANEKAGGANGKTGLASGTRPAELIALRKQASALRALRRCLGG